MNKITRDSKGDLITNPLRVYELSKLKKSVYLSFGRLPAAVILHWQLAEVMRLINQKALWEYIPKEVIPKNKRVINFKKH